jgi:hypothetical protein
MYAVVKYPSTLERQVYSLLLSGQPLFERGDWENGEAIYT